MDQTPPTSPEPATPPMLFPCPHCQMQLSVAPSQAGTTMACPQCQGNFQTPLPTASTGVGTGHTYGGMQDPAVRDFAGKKIAAGICGILLGGFGVHKFILGFTGAGVTMLLVSIGGIVLGLCLVVPILGAMAMSVIGLVEGIIYLTKSDEEFYRLYAVEKKTWF